MTNNQFLTKFNNLIDFYKKRECKNIDKENEILNLEQQLRKLKPLMVDSEFKIESFNRRISYLILRLKNVKCDSNEDFINYILYFILGLKMNIKKHPTALSV